MENNTFYNENIKERFLDTMDSDLIKTFSTLLFRKSKDTEEIMGKDIYEMSEDELGEVLSGLSCSTANAVYGNVIKMEEYITWAIENGLRRNNLNPLNSIDKKEWSKNFVATYKNNYFTREKIENMLDELANDTDKAILLALFEGIKGKGFSELFNLKPDDITEKDGVYWVSLKNDNGTERDLQISELLAQTLMNAHRQPEYFNKNGENRENGKHATSPFEDSPYIFKKALRGTKKDERLTFTFITRKFLLFKQVFELPHLKAKHITDSGIMYYANELQRNGELSTKELNEIGERFDTPFTYANGDNRYRNSTILKDIIEIDEFEELYGYKMTFRIDRS